MSEQSISSSSSSNEATKPKDQQQPFVKTFTKKNWDAIIDEFEKEEEKEAGIQDLFRQIYKSGSDEVRRAMNKSFLESDGTVLSTNWENVAEKRVEPNPPRNNDDLDKEDNKCL